MRRVLTAFLSFSLLLFVIGCSSNSGLQKNNAEKVIESTLENLDEAESFRIENEITKKWNDMGIEGGDNTVSCHIVNFKDKVQFIDFDLKNPGQETCYVEETESGNNIYVSSASVWRKQMGIPAEAVEKLGLSIDSHDTVKVYMDHMKNNCNMDENESSYILTGNIDASSEEILEKVGLGTLIDNLLESGLDNSQVEEVVSGAGEFKISVTVDKKLMLPTKVEMDLTLVTQNIMNKIAQVLGESSETEVVESISVSTYSQYSEIGDIIIPEEAVNAQEIQFN